MTHFVTLDRQQVGGTGLAEKIRELDTEIMAPFFDDLGQPFPIEKRMLAFARPGTLVVAQDGDGKLLGYLEYGAGWDRAEECYLNSIQIAPQHRFEVDPDRPTASRRMVAAEAARSCHRSL